MVLSSKNRQMITPTYLWCWTIRLLSMTRYKKLPSFLDLSKSNAINQIKKGCSVCSGSRLFELKKTRLNRFRVVSAYLNYPVFHCGRSSLALLAIRSCLRRSAFYASFVKTYLERENVTKRRPEKAVRSSKRKVRSIWLSRKTESFIR